MPPPWIAGDDVEAAHEVGGHERLVDDLLVQLVREVRVERATVDGPLAGAGHEADAGDGLLATAGRGGRRDGGRTRRVGGRGALGAVGDALLVGLEGLLDLGAAAVVSVTRVLGPGSVTGRSGRSRTAWPSGPGAGGPGRRRP